MDKRTRIMANAEEIYDLLKAMTPMQFCSTCQEMGYGCDEHGNLMSTTASAEELIERLEEE